MARFSKIDPCEVHPTANICDGAIIGKLFRPFLDGSQDKRRKTIVKKGVYIGHSAIVGSGSAIGVRCIVDDFSIIESRVVVDSGTLIIYRAQICNDASIGRDCVIGGFIGERTKVGNRCRVFGRLVHLQNEPQKGWDDDDVIEPAPVIDEGAFVGFGAIIAGPVKVGRRAYVCAGAIITRDVPDYHIAAERNRIVPFSEWNGRLRTSPFFMCSSSF